MFAFTIFVLPLLALPVFAFIYVLYSFSRQAVILVSLDGYRSSYFDRNFSPYIKKLGKLHLFVMLQFLKIILPQLGEQFTCTFVGVDR